MKQMTKHFRRRYPQVTLSVIAVLLGLVTGCENFLKRAVAMRRYLIAAVVAEVIALIVWLLFFLVRLPPFCAI
jgi:uncharacterized membrane protein YjfL (UPF0719 family)